MQKITILCLKVQFNFNFVLCQVSQKHDQDFKIIQDLMIKKSHFKSLGLKKSYYKKRKKEK